jgi:hypothetical protein
VIPGGSRELPRLWTFVPYLLAVAPGLDDGDVGRRSDREIWVRGQDPLVHLAQVTPRLYA